MEPDHIIIHHSLTKDGATVSWGAIREYHKDPAGPYKMQDIGYHWGIELINGHFEILKGRMDDVVGAHCKEEGMNNRSLGVCLVGNFDLAPPPDLQLALTVTLVKMLMNQHHIPVANVKRHSDYASKSCPGKLFPWQSFVERL